MATTATDDRVRSAASTTSIARQRTNDETKPSFMTTEFYAMVGVIGAVLVAAWVSDSLGDVRAWTLVSAVAIGYMISRGLAKAGSTHFHNDDNR